MRKVEDTLVIRDTEARIGTSALTPSLVYASFKGWTKFCAGFSIASLTTMHGTGHRLPTRFADVHAELTGKDLMQ